MNNKRHTQTDKVIDYVKKFGSITQFEAFTDLGISRLAARISEVENDRGIKVTRSTESHYNRFGEKTYCVRYSFEVPDGI